MQVFPKTLNLTHDGGTLECDLLLAGNDLCFEGHFPEFKLLPGVTQLHFVMLLAREYLGVPAEFSKITQLKFKDFIRPGDKPHLKLEKTADALVFSVTREGGICAQGKIIR